jgi:hypothetical protein
VYMDDTVCQFQLTMPKAIVATMHSTSPSFHMVNNAFLRSSLNFAWKARALMPRLASSSAISSHYHQKEPSSSRTATYSSTTTTVHKPRYRLGLHAVRHISLERLGTIPMNKVR